MVRIDVAVTEKMEPRMNTNKHEFKTKIMDSALCRGCFIVDSRLRGNDMV